MADSEQKDYYTGNSDVDTTDQYSSDDSEDDPSFEILEETRSSFSKLSIQKKAKSRILKEMDKEIEGDLEVITPDLDEKDQKSLEIVQKIIEVGQVDKLKVDQCKVYLRKNGLRLAGNKDTLIGRVKEHLDIVNGGGERKYPGSSFIVNCKGDACMGDVVMFEQNVYELFNIASRSASGPPCGTRVVAGRIVKESYGAAKQQHTFTIEVLWSKGEKPLPSLHPLLIKGRNLYKLNTMRQRWQDEGERQKIILEKHNRGSEARMNREARIQGKEMKKMLKAYRVSRTEYQERQPNEQQDNQTSPPTKLGKAKLQPVVQMTSQQENIKQKEFFHSKTWKEIPSVPSIAPYNRRTDFFPNVNMPPERINHRQPLTIMTQNPQPAKHQLQSFTLRRHTLDQSMNSNPFRRQINEQKKQQLCRYFAQGRCYYGDRCKYPHEYRETERDDQRTS